jgi:hypothetical protein
MGGLAVLTGVTVTSRAAMASLTVFRLKAAWAGGSSRCGECYVFRRKREWIERFHSGPRKPHEAYPEPPQCRPATGPQFRPIRTRKERVDGSGCAIVEWLDCSLGDGSDFRVTGRCSSGVRAVSLARDRSFGRADFSAQSSIDVPGELRTQAGVRCAT